jgi:hypothetical protein
MAQSATHDSVAVSHRSSDVPRDRPRASSRLYRYVDFKEVQMDRTVDVTIPVEPEAAAGIGRRA